MVHSAEGLGCGLRDLRDLERIRREREGDFIALGKEGEGGCEDFGESRHICCSHNTVID